jgi:hypothetical protein
MVPRVQVSADTIQFMKEVTHRKSRGDPNAVKARGLRKCFFTGSNTSCCQHICQHYGAYQQQCKKMDIPENTRAIPPEVLRGREETKKNVKKQVTLDGMMDSVKRPTEFGCEVLLHAVTQLVACDDQVCFSRFECTNDADRLQVVASTGGQSSFPKLSCRDETKDSENGFAQHSRCINLSAQSVCGKVERAEN